MQVWNGAVWLGGVWICSSRYQFDQRFEAGLKSVGCLRVTLSQ